MLHLLFRSSNLSMAIKWKRVTQPSSQRFLMHLPFKKKTNNLFCSQKDSITHDLKMETLQ